MSESPSTPLISVVVTTRNNTRTLEACLSSVRSQDYPHVELIVVDNASTDDTADIARRHADVFLNKGPERSAQRNAGVRAAQGDWVLWLDSDMVLPPTTLSVAMATAQESGADGVALPEKTIGPGFWTACRALERSCYLDDPTLHNPRLLRRDYLLGPGGFDLTMSGPEDTDLRMRMRAHGDSIVLAPVLIEHDEGRLTLREVMQKRVYYGRSLPMLSGVHSAAVPSQGRTVAQSYLRHRQRLRRQPLHATGMLFMRALEAGAYLWGARQGRRAASD